MTSPTRLRSILGIWTLVLSSLLLTSCASDSGARQVLVTKPVRCVHPEVDPRSYAGATQGLEAYWGAMETCNIANGFDAPLETLGTTPKDKGQTKAIIVIPGAKPLVTK